MAILRLIGIWLVLFTVVAVNYSLAGGHNDFILQPFYMAMLMGIYVLGFWPTGIYRSTLQSKHSLNKICALGFLAIAIPLKLRHAAEYYDEGREIFVVHLAVIVACIVLAALAYMSMEFWFRIEENKK